MATTEEDGLGSGIALDEDLDMMLSNDGDLLSVSGFEELEKDLSVNMIFQLTFGGPDNAGYLGKPLTPEVKADILDLVKRTALADDRINSVQRIAVSRPETQRNVIDVDLTVVTSIEERNLIITVGDKQ